MRIDGPSIAPTLPHHVAVAYGVKSSSASAVVAKIAPVSPAAANPYPSESRSDGVRRLVGAVVPGGVEFSQSGEAQASRPTGESAYSPLAMYRHPADKNAAATAVNVGRRLDVQG